MEPQSPVVKGLEPYEIVLAADQPEYAPLAVLRSASPNYGMLSRWSPTDEEREQIAQGADIYLTIYTFGGKFPPVAMQVASRSPDPDPIRERMELDRELNERLRAIFAAAAQNGEQNEQV